MKQEILKEVKETVTGEFKLQECITGGFLIRGSIVDKSFRTPDCDGDNICEFIRTIPQDAIVKVTMQYETTEEIF